MTERYSLDAIKQKFIKYRELKYSQITDDEYTFFCDVLHILPTKIIDHLEEEVEFVLLSGQQRRAVNSACMIPLDYEDLKNKRALIILTPIIFGFGIDWNKHEDDQRWAILHEIAHFCLKTKTYKDQEDLEGKEKEADELTQKWFDDFFNE